MECAVEFVEDKRHEFIAPRRIVMNETRLNTRKRECLLFLSWQSDRKESRRFISSVIEKIPAKLSDIVTVNVDKDTVNVPGSPDIGDTIFEKIDRCDLFIADITLINDKESGYRKTPNPNVLIELGYAIKTLGWNRILLLQCIDYGDVEEIPFDINHRRICSFSLGIDEESVKDKSEKKKQSMQKVIQNIETSIRLLLAENLLFGGVKRKIPKFEITFQGNSGCMMNLILKIKNVSSLMISVLRSQELMVLFADGSNKVLKCTPTIQATSLATGEHAIVHLNNPILGVDLVKNGGGFFEPFNAWRNFDLLWQFTCEDEDGNEFWYEMRQHINDAKESPRGVWPNKYIG